MPTSELLNDFFMTGLQTHLYLSLKTRIATLLRRAALENKCLRGVFWTSKLRTFLYIFVPQFVRTRYFHDENTVRLLHETSWLDGLRGLAALFVFQHHYLNPFTDMGLVAMDARHPYIIQLPILRSVYCGAAQVNMFFIIGGYVISIKPLKYMRQDDTFSRDKLLQTLFSTVFRRFFRIFLPVLVSTQFIVLATYCGLFDFVNDKLNDRTIFPRASFRIVPRYPSLMEQYAFWLQDMRGLTNFAFERGYNPTHDLALWTLPFEFRAGMTVMLCLLAVSRLQRGLRLASLLSLSVYYFHMDRWPVTYFLWGSCIAELDVRQQQDVIKHVREARSDYAEGVPQPISQFSLFQRVSNHWPFLPRTLQALAIMLALYLYSVPENNFAVAYGYRSISTLWPQRWGVRPFAALGTVLILLTLRLCGPKSSFRVFLEHPVIQHLGRLSFSIYLIHGPVLRIIGVYLPIFIWKFIPRDVLWSYVTALTVGWFLNLMLILWISEILEKSISVL